MQDTRQIAEIAPQKSLYVYQLPVRVWHWGMVCCVCVLAVTGYIIGKPWLSVAEGPPNVFYMGYTRMAHFTAAFVLITLTLLRVIFAFVGGNHYARELFILPVWKAAWRKSLWKDIRWLLFLEKSPTPYAGHNPLAQVGMASGMLFMTAIVFTGLGLYAQSSVNPLLMPFRFVQDIVYALGGNVQTLRGLHRLGMLMLLSFIMVHIYMVIREEIMGKTTLASTMFSGYRMLRNGD